MLQFPLSKEDEIQRFFIGQHVFLGMTRESRDHAIFRFLRGKLCYGKSTQLYANSVVKTVLGENYIRLHHMADNEKGLVDID